ncbi:MAG: sigma-70 family RNA polymerase sigma factor [Planctomycetaceae bacterium]|jgi:RNA polymerase primary sigma factor/RNA polymerase sigma factor|nr:sigma-70 family RNA polymerase sigma factor [Planctomycetaceae bacterium]
MNKDYRNAILKELRDQLVRYVPKDKKLEQISRAEELLHEIDNRRIYSYKYLSIRVTEFGTDVYEDVLMSGDDVRYDLLLLIEDLSDSAEIDSCSVNEKIWTIDELCKRFNVASKTISRWRKEQLSGRKFLFNNKKRVGFLDSSVNWFVEHNSERIQRGSRYNHLSETEKVDLIKKSRELAAQGISQTETARRLAENSGRSPETIRYTLKTFDANNADIAIFPSQNEPLYDQIKQQIFKEYNRGETVSSLAFHYHRTIGSIYRIVGQMRAEQIMNLPIQFIDSPEFARIHNSVDETQICGPTPKTSEEICPKNNRRTASVLPDGLPSYLALLYDVPLLAHNQEQHLFRKMNYLKYKAALLRNSLNQEQPKTDTMQQIEYCYNSSLDVKNEIILANLRLVVSIAKRHVSKIRLLFDLISDGNISLMRAVDKFDYTRGNRFSTYASWAIIRNFARTIPDEQRYRERFTPTDADKFDSTIDFRNDSFVSEKTQMERESQVEHFLQELDAREQRIITRRFGLGQGVQPFTLRQVGEEIGVTKERVRQIESRALAKLRKAAKEESLEIPGLQ